MFSVSMAKKKNTEKNLTEEQQKEIKLLKASNEMYEKSKEEARLRGNDKAVKRLEIAQQEVQAQIQQLLKGTDIDVMKIVNPDEVEQKTEIPSIGDRSIFDILDEQNKIEKQSDTYSDDSNIKQVDSIGENEETTTEKNVSTESNFDSMFNNVDPSAQYDVVPLPSNGECYENKLARIPVGFLTAYDENFITSPNLYKDGLIIDFLLKSKVLNKDVDTDKLVKGDVDAITLFLRATSYGYDFPVIVRDPKTGEEIETVVDLSKIKSKKFTLKADDNGNFEYILPISKVPVKFKYLTRKEERDLETLAKIENNGIRSNELKSAASLMRRCLDEDKVLASKDRGVMLESIRNVEKWAHEIEKGNPTKFSKTITNRMEMQIVAINGNYDREYVRKAIMNMPAHESLMLRRYILENEPGMDFEIEIERPENLGGGSFKTFLEWDDSVFLNIS